ncbi:D-alanyl-D-alanine carboxypeptidase family protein [Arthrobacter sp.]|uniref:D-alanyl-D-alanine carboxypeptidase family protein n=1 Tax=Arthrobacter sp. TaxID=1667 RepID=UPI003A912327
MPTSSRLHRRSAAVATSVALAAALLLPAHTAWASPVGDLQDAQATPSTGPAPSPGDAGHEEKTRTPSREQAFAAYTTDPTSPLVLVNEHHPLQPRDYTPAKLVAVNGSGARMVPDAAHALEKLIAAARRDGHGLIVESAYRSYDHQMGLFRRYTNQYGEAYASKISARPGTSEHQLGLSADIGVGNGQCSLRACLADLPGGRWTARHAADFGFIIRYPKDQQQTTGYNFEPWHLRYVGTTAARTMREQHIATFEQYSQQLVDARNARKDDTARKQAEAKRQAAVQEAVRRATADSQARRDEETRWMPDWARAATTHWR